MFEYYAAADVFSRLAELIREHPDRTPLIGTLITCGGKFVEVSGAGVGTCAGLGTRGDVG